jgi:hypothetical protein
MKKTWKSFIVLFTLLITALGCSEPKANFTSEEKTTFLSTLSTTDVNQSLQLSVEGDNKSFLFGSEIHLVVNNFSSSSIVLDSPTPIKLLMIQDSKWVEVDNEITYSGEKNLSPKGTILFDTGGIPIQPAIQGDKELTIRAVVTGEVIKDNIRTGNLAVAYIDLYLIP